MLVVTVCGVHPVVAVTADSGSVTAHETLTLLRYQPFVPSVPVTVGVITGGVVSTATVSDAPGATGVVAPPSVTVTGTVPSVLDDVSRLARLLDPRDGALGDVHDRELAEADLRRPCDHLDADAPAREDDLAARDQRDREAARLELDGAGAGGDADPDAAGAGLDVDRRPQAARIEDLTARPRPVVEGAVADVDQVREPVGVGVGERRRQEGAVLEVDAVEGVVTVVVVVVLIEHDAVQIPRDRRPRT